MEKPFSRTGSRKGIDTTPGAGNITAAAAPGYLLAPATRQLAVQIAKVLEDSFRRGESTISMQPAGGSRSGKRTRSVI